MYVLDQSLCDLIHAGSIKVNDRAKLQLCSLLICHRKGVLLMENPFLTHKIRFSHGLQIREFESTFQWDAGARSSDIRAAWQAAWTCMQMQLSVASSYFFSFWLYSWNVRNTLVEIRKRGIDVRQCCRHFGTVTYDSYLLPSDTKTLCMCKCTFLLYLLFLAVKLNTFYETFTEVPFYNPTGI